MCGGGVLVVGCVVVVVVVGCVVVVCVVGCWWWGVWWWCVGGGVCVVVCGGVRCMCGVHLCDGVAQSLQEWF